MRLLFFGSSVFSLSVLEALHKNHRVIGVITQPDRPKGRGRRIAPTVVKLFAQKEGLFVLDPENLDQKVLETLKGLLPDIIVVAAYGKILPSEYLKLAPLGAINVHPSLLPKYRGPSPIQWVLLKGEKETGVTTFLMDEGLDSGPILLQEKLPIQDEETYSSLLEKLSHLAARLTLKTLEEMGKGTLIPIPQDHQKACYTKKIDRSLALINWNRPAKEVWNKVRALEGWPCAYTFWQGKLLKIWRASLGEGRGEPGTIIGLKEGIEVACSEGSLIIKELQLEGGKRMGSSEFLRGHRLDLGERVG